MLALIIFSFLIGFACLRSGEKGAPFRSFLSSGDEVMKQLLHLIMKRLNRIRRLFRLPSWYFLSSIIWCICEAIGSLLWVCAFLLCGMLLCTLLQEGQMG
jgi:Na+/H+-dicarboxylate symporter